MQTRSNKTIQFRSVAAKLIAIAERSRFTYYCLTFAAALMGMLFILMFPALIILGLSQLDSALYKAFAENEWLDIAFWMPVITISTIVSCRIVSIRIPSCAGINVNTRTVPDLVSLVAQLKQTYKKPKLDNIVISDQFILDIVKTPLFGLPISSTNTLVIGLPVLQTLSPLHFKIALARKLGQFTKTRDFFSNWLYQLRYTWAQYNDIYAERNHSGDQILSWFFKVYAPFYNAVSTYAYNTVNMRTDTSALEHISDIDLLHMIEHSIISRTFLNNIYWPNICEMVSKDPLSSPHPFYRMTEMFHKTLAKCDINRLLNDTLLNESTSKCGELTLQERLDNIGYNRITNPEILKTTAAVQYLGHTYHSIVGLMDRFWITHRLPQLKLANSAANKENIPMYAYGNIANNI